MYPILLVLGPVKIFTYGFFIALGFLTGITLARREAVRLGQEPDKIMDLCFWCLIAAIVGSRFFYIFTVPDTFLKDPMEIFRIWKGGLVFYGGFIGALLTGIVFFKKYKMPVWITLDIMAPSIAIGHALGRIGCFFAGCCYGRECDLPWAIVFNHPDSLAPKGILMHPTQLYSSLSNFGIFLFLLILRKYKRFDGQVFWVYVFIYGIMRSIIETFRADFRGGEFLNLFSISQIIGISFSLTALFMLGWLRSHRAARPAAPTPVRPNNEK